MIGIDLKSKTVTKKIESQSKPHWFVMTPDGRKAYTCNKTQPFISVLDLMEGTFLGKIEVPSCEEPGMSLDGKYAYFPTPGLTVGPPPPDASIKVIDTTTDKIVNSIATGLGPQAVHVTSLNTIMVAKSRYGTDASGEVTKAQPGRLALHAPDTHELLGEVAVDLGPLTIRSSPDGKTGFVANVFSGTVTVIDLSSMTIVRTLNNDTMPNPAKANHLGAHGMACW